MSRPAAAPRDLVPGYSARRGAGAADYAGVLRDGYRVVWSCPAVPGHRHIAPGPARRCAEDERERRVQGAAAVLALAHCEPCGAYWDLAPCDRPELLRGRCPRCSVPCTRVKAIVLEEQP